MEITMPEVMIRMMVIGSIEIGRHPGGVKETFPAPVIIFGRSYRYGEKLI